MKIGFMGVCLAAGIAFAAAPAHAQGAELDTEKKRFSYTIGYQIGQSLKEDGLDVDVNALSQAIADVLEGDRPRLSMDEMQAAVHAFQMEQMERRGAAAGENLRRGRAFLEENRRREGVVERESGLQYEVIEEGAGARPTEQDTVVVEYRGTLIDGTEFDSSYRRGEPAVFPVDAVIPGWREALTLMREGAVWKVAIPPELAYGERGAGQDIGPNETLIFDIELIAIQ